MTIRKPRNKYLVKPEGITNKKRLPWVLSKEQLLKILMSLKDLRFAMVISIGIFQGLRIGEMIMLKWSDIDLEHGELRVLDGKNTRRFKSSYGKDRIVPINQMFIPIFKKWRAMNPDETYVLPTTKKRDDMSLQGMVRTYQEKMNEVLTKLGMLEEDYLQKDGKARYKYHLHTFRHVCGTNLYRCGMDIYQLKEYLGHANVQNTMLYCELARDDLQKASHKAFAFPKSHLTQPENTIQIGIDKETLLIQQRILEQQLELARMTNPLVVENGNLS